MKKKIFSLILILTVFLGFAFTSQAQAEFIDDNTFIVSNQDYTINEEDVEELFLFFVNYVEKYNIGSTDLGIDGKLYDISNNLYGGLNIDFQADLISLDISFDFIYDISSNFMHISMRDFNNEIVISAIRGGTNEVSITELATYDFNVVITLFEIEPEPPLTIFGFFKKFYSNYIFPDNLLDTQTLNLITAVTTLMFFIGVIRGLYSIFFRNKRK